MIPSTSDQQLCPKEVDIKENKIKLQNEIENSVLQSKNDKIIEIPSEIIVKTKWYKTLKGIALTIISALFFSLTTVIVKYVDGVGPEEMAFFRFLGILLFTIPILMEYNANPLGPSNMRHWLILRGIAGASSLYFRYSALQYMSIANATVIVLSMPVFVFIFAKIFLKESFDWFNILSLFVTLIGIAFTSKLITIFTNTEEVTKQLGINTRNEFLGLAFSLAATLIGSSAYVLVRKIKCLHHSLILFNFSVVAIIETSVITLCLNDFNITNHLDKLSPNGWLLALLAILSFYGQLLLTKALQSEEAGLVSIVRVSSEVIYAFIFQITLFKQMPDMWSIVGTVLVMASVVMTAVRKWIQSTHKEDIIGIKM